MSYETERVPTSSSLPGLKSEIFSIARLAFPIVISLAAAALIGVVDTIMIAPLGTLPLAAVSVAGSIILIFYAALYGYVSVSSVRMAAAYGKKSPAALSQATKTGLIIAAATGVLAAGLMLAMRPFLGWIGQPPEVIEIIGSYWTAMSLLLIPYTMFYALKALFDTIDRAWVGVGLSFVAVALNIPANLVLIHGVGGWDGLGLFGAGLASLLSQTVSLLLALIIWRRAKATAAAREPASPTQAEFVIQIREGSAISTGYIGEAAAYSLASLMMGWFGVIALAANQIVASVGAVLYMVPLGVASAVSIRIGQAIGADERARLIPIGTAALCVIIFWMSLVMMAVFAGAGLVSSALSNDAQVVTLATSMFLVVACMQIADGVQGTMMGAVRGMMDNHVPVVITLFCYWLIALPLAYILGFLLELGPNAIWVGYGSGLFISAFALTRRFFIKARE